MMANWMSISRDPLTVTRFQEERNTTPLLSQPKRSAAPM